jgi:hypothetical protein
MLDMIGSIWYVFGNWWLFSSKTCSNTNPNIYWLSVVIIAIGYFMLAFPILFCGAVIFCLPGVLVLLRWLRLGNLESSISPANGLDESIINRITEYHFKLKGSASKDKHQYLELSQEEGNCVICISDYEEDQLCKVLPCKHHYHSACIDEWLHLQKTCPLCIQEVVIEDLQV